MKIAWLGTGVMGAPMAGHLVRAGHEVKAWNRTLEKAVRCGEEYGFSACASLAEAVAGVDAVLTMLGFPRDVEEIYLGPGGLLETVAPGCLLIDFTTSSPSLAARIQKEAQKKGLEVLDAPVSGGDRGAREGQLAIMVGGEEAAYERARPLFEAFGKTISYMGPAGSGQHTKAANQIAVAGATAAYTEALAYASSVGLDPARMLQAIGGGAAGSWQIDNMAPRVLKRDFEPGFFIKHFIKDMNIVADESALRKQELPVLLKVLDLFQKLARRGHENEGTQALIQYYEDGQP